MSTNNNTNRGPERANELDALLNKAVKADQRANRPTSAPTIWPAVGNSALDRLSVRYTQAEAAILEKVRVAARALGLKISDAAIYRLALNAFQVEHMTRQSIEMILASDTRRRGNRAQSQR